MTGAESHAAAARSEFLRLEEYVRCMRERYRDAEDRGVTLSDLRAHGEDATDALSACEVMVRELEAAERRLEDEAADDAEEGSA